MAEEERNSDSKDTLRSVVGLSGLELARNPLSASTPRPVETDVVVDLTGESDEEEVVDLTTPTDTSSMIISVNRDRVSVDRDGLSVDRDGLSSYREQVNQDRYSPVSETLPLSETSPMRERDIPPVPATAPQPVSVNSEDDVIIVSSYCPEPPHAHNVPPFSTTPTSPSPADLAPHISRIITCPICMDTQKVFTRKGSSLVATKCGHLFCDSCLKKAISVARKCPTCSSKLTSKQFHRIYI